MEPYQPCCEASSVSGLMTCAYDGCRSSRRGGSTTIGLGPTGALPLTLMVSASELPFMLSVLMDGMWDLVVFVVVISKVAGFAECAADAAGRNYSGCR